VQWEGPTHRKESPPEVGEEGSGPETPLPSAA
jgi:hypothetical protein